MMTIQQVMADLEKMGSEQTRKTLARHGAPAKMFGVKIGDLKPIAKKIKGQQELAYALYETGNSDAMYLAGLVADGSKMTRRQLDSARSRIIRTEFPPRNFSLSLGFKLQPDNHLF